jgi:transcriptional regulator GlxA family with amidase domain
MISSPLTHIWFVLPSGSLILDWAGPAEAFRMANGVLPGQAFFQLHFCAPTSTTTSSVGSVLSQLEPLPSAALLAQHPSWVVLVGKSGGGLRHKHISAEDAAVLQWAQSIQPGRAGARLVTVCNGALLAARAGLLRGRSVTTHHDELTELQAIDPSMRVQADRVFVHDGDVWTSAGVTAGIDLALYLISEHCGPVVAARVAQNMAVALRRGPNDPQLSPFLAHRQHFHRKLHQVQDAVTQNPTADWSASAMATHIHTTARSLSRLFAQHTSTTPQAYVREIRVALARTALQAGNTVTQAALAAGFSSDLQLRRAWLASGKADLPSAARANIKRWDAIF